jgi:hypothetical protein
MTEERIAPCGLDCAKCDMYIATKADNDEMRQTIADKWTQLFHYNFKKEDINCDGCLAGGRMGLYCRSMCKIKPCALSHGVTNCKNCPEYKCEILIQNQKESEAYIKD